MSVECFVTGGTGFIGQHLLANLSAKGHTVRVLMRRPERLAALREQVDNLGGISTRVFAVAGDLERDNLGLSPSDQTVLRQSRVVFHLGAHFAWGAFIGALSCGQCRRGKARGAAGGWAKESLGNDRRLHAEKS